MKPGQAVHIQLNSKSKWEKGEVVRKDNTPRSYHVRVNGGVYRRNSKFIKEDKRLAGFPNTSSRRKDNEHERYQREHDKSNTSREDSIKGSNQQGEKFKTSYNKRQFSNIIHRRWNNKDIINNTPKMISSDGHGSRSESGLKDNPNRYGRMIRKPEKLNL